MFTKSMTWSICCSLLTDRLSKFSAKEIFAFVLYKLIKFYLINLIQLCLVIVTILVIQEVVLLKRKKKETKTVILSKTQIPILIIQLKMSKNTSVLFLMMLWMKNLSLIHQLATVRAPIGFGNYRTELIGFGIGTVSVFWFTEPNLSVNLPIGFGNCGFGIGFAIYRTDLPNWNFR